MTKCRLCDGQVYQFFDFGRQPLSDAFRKTGDTSAEFFYRLAVGVCQECTMVQLMEEIPRERMFREDYPYRSSLSSVMRTHFEQTAHRLMADHCRTKDPFVVEIGCNDGTMLRTIAQSGIRHLGVDPSREVTEIAAADGVRVRVDFFEEALAEKVRDTEGPAQVVYAANTMCHIPYADSVFRGVDALLDADGVFIFEDPYLGDILERNSFDQIYDEHFYIFSATSVQAMAQQFGFALVDAERLPTHGGEVRYTLVRANSRQPSKRVTQLLAEEGAKRISEVPTLEQFGVAVKHNCGELVTFLQQLKKQGLRVAAYGATAKSATVTNYAGIGPEILPAVYDSTPAKQGRLTPGVHIPVVSMDEFKDPYPDYVLLFAWNHAAEIIAKEQEFRNRGGKWIQYVPEVRVV